MLLYDMVYKFNPYHDEQGKFASAPGGGKVPKSFGKKFSSVYEADQWAREAWTDWAAGLSPDVKTQVAEYKNNTTAFAVNKALRQQKSGEMFFRGGFQARSVDEVARGLDEALSTAKAPEDMMLFRGADWPDVKVGDLIHDRGFVSTSLRKNVGQRFTGGRRRLVEIRVKKGQSAASLERWTRLDTESEVLLPRNSKFRVVQMDDKRIVVDYLGV